MFEKSDTFESLSSTIKEWVLIQENPSVAILEQYNVMTISASETLKSICSNHGCEEYFYSWIHYIYKAKGTELPVIISCNVFSFMQVEKSHVLLPLHFRLPLVLVLEIMTWLWNNNELEFFNHVSYLESSK